MMKLILLVMFIAIGVSGCSNKEAEENQRKAKLYDLQQAAAAAANSKQQRLEECFEQARKDNLSSSNAWLNGGCDTPSNRASYELVLRCNAELEIIKERRKSDEARCVQLYK